MTAEIAIMNRHGVALAADSAVSIGHGGSAKIYNTVNKLFSGSKHAPVGIMVFGNALLTGVPWETVVKAFLQNLGNRSFDSLAEYAECIVQFVETEPGLFSEDDERREFEASCTMLCRLVVDAIVSELHQQFERRGEISEAELRQTVAEVLRRQVDSFSSGETRLESLPPSYGQGVLARFRDSAERIRNATFEQLPLIGDSLELFDELLVCWIEAPPSGMANQAGLVVAGFGEAEYTPSLSEFELHGFLNGHLRRRTVRKETIDAASEATVLPFAQREMVDMFMTGIDPTLQKTMSSAFRHLVDTLPGVVESALADQSSDHVTEAVRESARQLVQAYESELGAQVDRAFVQPVLRATASLPKEELADMAAALVNLTSFKRRVTLEAETVGGPIDVAVISKGDGLIWIHRKHYFAPDLNHHFFANYFNYGECMRTEEHS